MPGPKRPVVGTVPAPVSMHGIMFLMVIALGFMLGTIGFLNWSNTLEHRENSRSLRLPDAFSLVEPSREDSISQWVEDASTKYVWGEIGRDYEDRGNFNKVYYHAFNGQTLMRGMRTVANGVTRLDVINLRNKRIAAIKIDETGTPAIEISDDAGVLMASGSRDETGEVTLFEPNGLKVATLGLDPSTKRWHVQVHHPSVAPNTVFLMIIGAMRTAEIEKDSAKLK